MKIGAILRIVAL